MDESVYERGYPANAWPRLIPILHERLPFDVSIGRWDDKATWRLDPKDGATAEQQMEAEQILDAFDPWEAETKSEATPDPAPSGVFDSQLEEVRAAYEESHDGGSDEVGLGEPADDDPGGDLGTEAGDSPPDDPDPSDAIDEPDPAQLGGVLIREFGDALTTSKALLSWQVDAIEAERLGVYDEAEITSELAALRNRAMGAREYGWTALNDAENEQLQALETFEGHIRAIQAHSRSLRGQIRDAVDEAALALIDIQSGWPE